MRVSIVWALMCAWRFKLATWRMLAQSSIIIKTAFDDISDIKQVKYYEHIKLIKV